MSDCPISSPQMMTMLGLCCCGAPAGATDTAAKSEPIKTGKNFLRIELIHVFSLPY